MFKITMKNTEMLHWYFISSIILPDFVQVTVLSETGRVIHFHKSKQQIVLLWPYFYPLNPAYLFIKIFTGFGQVLFFKKGLKRKKNKARITFLCWNFLPINEKSVTSSFLQSLPDGFACLLSTPWGIPIFTLKIWIARCCRFRLWIITDLSFANNPSKTLRSLWKRCAKLFREYN